MKKKLLVITSVFLGIWTAFFFAFITFRQRQEIPKKAIAPSRSPIFRPQHVKTLVFNSNDAKITPYSFEYPEPQNCSGCYDAGGDYTNHEYYSYSIESHYSQDFSPSEAGWRIVVRTLKQTSTFYPELTHLSNELYKMQINEPTQILISSDKKEYSFKRLEDKQVAGRTAKIYQTKYSPWPNPFLHKKYAVLVKDGFYYTLEFEWSEDRDAPIFDTVLSSFQFSSKPAK